MDFAGLFQGHSFMIVVDAYLKWVKAISMPLITSETVIKVLHRNFATHGLPDVMVSDNGPQLMSARFHSYLAGLGIRHATIAPYHPVANGLAERAVRSAKDVLTKLGMEDWQTKLDTYLLTQHTTPCLMTNHSPAELLMGCRLRTVLDHLHPEYSPEKPLDSAAGSQQFQENYWVYTQNYGVDPKWFPGRIIEVTGPCSYRVQLEDGRLWRQHIDQLRWHHLPAIDPISSGPLSATKIMEPINSDPHRYKPSGANNQAANLPLMMPRSGTESPPIDVTEQSPRVPEASPLTSPEPPVTTELRRSSMSQICPAYL